MKVLSYEDLREKGILLSTVQLWRLEKAGKFPKSFHYGGGQRKGWDEAEVDAHLESQKAARHGQEAA